MKKLICISGTMGVGKTTVCQKLKYELEKCVFLDGDWCWDMHPFVVNEETKAMVMNNIAFQLNAFLRCSSIEHVLFCWVMHEQDIIDDLMNRLDCDQVRVYHISLICDEEKLREQLQRDIDQGLRKPDILKRSLKRMRCYHQLSTTKIDMTSLSIDDIVEEIRRIIK